MKKILTYSLLATLVVSGFGSCAQEEADLFDQSAAERLNEAKDLFTQRVASSPNGWIFEYYPSPETDFDNCVKGLGYLMLVNFKSDNSCVVGMKNCHTNDVYWEDESLWEVITDMSAVLSFNSFNKCVHCFSQPENFFASTSYGGDIGKGMLGDYEFVIVDAPEGGDHILLKGKKHGAYCRLTRLSQSVSFEEYIDDVTAKHKELLSMTAPNHMVLSVGEKKYNFIMIRKGNEQDSPEEEKKLKDVELGLAELWPEGTDPTFTMVYNPLLLTRQDDANGHRYVLRFRDPIQGADEDTWAQEFFYDPVTQSFHGEDENVSIVGENVSSFFFTNWENGAKFSFNSKSEGSDKVKNAIKALNTAYSGLKYSFQSAQLRPSDKGASLLINYRDNKNRSGSIAFNYSVSHDGDNLTLQYLAPETDAAQKQYDSLPALAEMVSMLNATFLIVPGANALNLSTIALQKQDDADWRLVTSYTK